MVVERQEHCITIVEAAAGTAAAMRNTALMAKTSVGKVGEAKLKKALPEALLQLKPIDQSRVRRGNIRSKGWKLREFECLPDTVELDEA